MYNCLTVSNHIIHKVKCDTSPFLLRNFSLPLLVDILVVFFCLFNLLLQIVLQGKCLFLSIHVIISVV